MNQYLLYWPVLAQVLLPLLVLILNAKRKAADVKSGNFDRSKAAMNNEAWSVPVILTSKNLANQFQLPVLFFVVCFVLVGIEGVTVLSLVVAWLYVASRYVHAAVHVTSNHVPHRMRVFILSVVFLLILLITAVVQLAQTS